MASDRVHTRIVRGAKIALPLIALAILSLLFLLARRIDPADAIPISEVDVSERARDLQLTAPRVSGVSGAGTAYRVTAATARPDADDPRRMSFGTLRLDIGDAAGGTAEVTARTGAVDTGARRVALDGDVRIDTSTGFALRTERLDGTLGQLDVSAPGAVRGTGPLGTLSAGAMRLSEDAQGRRTMAFTGGVELVYTPPDP